MPGKGKTVVCNTETCVVGNFKPMATGTAHQRVAKAAGITPVVAGSIKQDGSIEIRSESVNRTNFDMCDMKGTAQGDFLEEQIRKGNIQSVREFKASKK